VKIVLTLAATIVAAWVTLVGVLCYFLLEKV
jgi:hypothetical protein